jgi:hypothetical protein
MDIPHSLGRQRLLLMENVNCQRVGGASDAPNSVGPEIMDPSTWPKPRPVTGEGRPRVPVQMSPGGSKAVLGEQRMHLPLATVAGGMLAAASRWGRSDGARPPRCWASRAPADRGGRPLRRRRSARARGGDRWSSRFALHLPAIHARHEVLLVHAQRRAVVTRVTTPRPSRGRKLEGDKRPQCGYRFPGAAVHDSSTDPGKGLRYGQIHDRSWASYRDHCCHRM